MLESTRRKILEEVHKIIETKLEIFKDSIHTHKSFFISPVANNRSIDEMVNYLYNENNQIKRVIEQLNAELYTIHYDYRNKLCSNCCHKTTCKDSENIKYGYQCKNRICIINRKN